MTALTEASDILNALAGKELTETRQMEMIEDFLAYDSAKENLSNEEKAEKYNTQARFRLLAYIKSGAQQRWTRSHAVELDEHLTASVKDL